MRRVGLLCVIWLAMSCSDGSGPSSAGFQAVALSIGGGRQVCGIVSDASLHSLYKPTFGLGADGKGYWWGPPPYWTGGGPQTPELFSGDMTLSAIGTNDLGVRGIERGTSEVYCWNQFSDGNHADPAVLVPRP